MKRIALIFITILLFPDVYAQKQKNQIHAAVVGFFNGMSLTNADTLKNYSTTDFHLLEDGQVWNMDTLLNKVIQGKNPNVKRTNSFEFIKTEQKGKTAWVSYNNTAEFKNGERRRVVRWLESAVLKKAKGGWKIQMLHSTRLK
jgi:ketosteroid isomerase-like protein